MLPEPADFRLSRALLQLFVGPRCHPGPLMLAPAVPAVGRSAAGCRTTSIAAPRGFGYLEPDVAAMASNFGADLDQLFPQAGQRPWLRPLGHRQCPHEIAKIVGCTIWIRERRYRLQKCR